MHRPLSAWRVLPRIVTGTPSELPNLNHCAFKELNLAHSAHAAQEKCARLTDTDSLSNK